MQHILPRYASRPDQVDRFLERNATRRNAARVGVPQGLKLRARLASGASGVVWSAFDGDGRMWAVKEQPLGSVEDVEDFQRELHYQNLFAQGGVALPVVDAWVKNGVGVIKMQAIDTTLASLIEEFSDNDATHRETLTWMAEEVKRLQAQVAALGLVHGDMHFGNIALAVGDDRHSARLVLIDFGKSLELKGVSRWSDLRDADVFWVWRASFDSPINPFLKAVGFPGSKIMKSICRNAKPDSTSKCSGEMIDMKKRGSLNLWEAEKKAKQLVRLPPGFTSV